MKRFFVASAFALFCVGLASAQQDIVSARIALMKALIRLQVATRARIRS